MSQKKIIFQSLLSIGLMLISFLSFAQKPIITSADKTTAANGEIITFQGIGFGTNPANLSVSFGAAKGVVKTPVSDQFLEVAVPAGATYDKISVTNLPSGLTEYTAKNFLLSFGGNHGFGPANLEGQKNINAETGLYDLCMCDFDGDNQTDIAAVNDNSNFITILENTSSAPGLATLTFSKLTLVQVPQILLNTRSVHTTCGDLNGDGKPDLVVTEGGSMGDRVFIFQNGSTSGNFVFSVQSIKLIGKKVNRVKISDLDHDGKPELVVTNQISDPTKAVPNVTVLVNQSNTTTIAFSSTHITVPIPGAASTDGLDIDDLNGDNFPDVIASQFLTASSNVFILKNTSSPGNITFETPITLPITGGVVNIKTGDLDNDQRPDIAVTQVLATSISVFLNQSTTGNISFAAPSSIITRPRPWGLDFGDLDGDTKPDIIVASLEETALSILNNQSTPGSLSFQHSVKTTDFINRHILIGDLDGDAKPDVAFTSVDNNNAVPAVPASMISIFRNTSCPKPEVTPTGPHTVCAGFPLKLSTSNNPGTTYEWKNGATPVYSGPNAFFDVTATGNYTVTSTSEGGTCALTSNNVTVTVEPGTTTGSANPRNNGPICIGSTLVLEADHVGGTEYIWTGPNGYNGTTINPAPIPNFQAIHAGRYNLDVKIGSCIAQQVSTVVEAVAIPAFQISSGSSTVVCPPDTKTLTLSPNLGAFTYQWFERSSATVLGTSTTYNATASGEYYVKATYTANPACATVETPGVVITFATPLSADFTLPATTCRGQDITFTNTSTSDPSVAVTYTWDFGDGSSNSSDVNPVHRYLTASTFTITLRASYSNNACENTRTRNLIVQPAPLAIITTPEGQFSFCPEGNLVLEVPGPFTSYSWNTNGTTPTITVTEAGIYAVEVTTTTGCIVNASQEVTMFESPEVIIVSDPAQINEGQAAELQATGLQNYLWEPGESLSGTTIPDPVATPLVTTTYTVTGTDANGCAGEATYELKVQPGSIYEKIKPSPFFSPENGDEFGKFWNIEKIEEYPDCQITVYDVKGVKVHEAKPYLNTWDGTFKGQKLPDGVYYFIIKCKGEEKPPKTGSITLLR